MSNSRFNLKTENATNTSRQFGKMSLNVYKPGFIDTATTESMKMSIDRELGELSKALFQTAENTSKEIEDAVGGVDLTEIKEELAKLEIKTGENSAAITDEALVRATEDGALGERISNVKAESDAGIAQVTQTTTALSNSVGKLEAKWGVQVNVNNKIAGIALNNDGASSSFEVIADRFSISDGTHNTGAPFEVVNGQTKIKNASVGTIHSDNWNGNTVGWAITKDGFASFNNVTVRGHVEAGSGSFSGTVNANSGVFNNVTVAENCNILGTIYAKKLSGDVGNEALQLLPYSYVDGTFRSFNKFSINNAEEYNRIFLLTNILGASSDLATINTKLFFNGGEVFNRSYSTTINGNQFMVSCYFVVPAGQKGVVDFQANKTGAGGVSFFQGYTSARIFKETGALSPA